MKKVFTAMISSLIALGFLTATFGQEEQTKPQEQQRKTNTYSGIVHKVDVKKKIIVAGKPNSELAMSFEAAEAKFVDYKGLKDIKKGDKVLIEYDVKIGKTIAVTVTKEK